MKVTTTWFINFQHSLTMYQDSRKYGTSIDFYIGIYGNLRNVDIATLVVF